MQLNTYNPPIRPNFANMNIAVVLLDQDICDASKEKIQSLVSKVFIHKRKGKYSNINKQN